MARILVVDDEPSIRSMLCEVLRRNGHAVESARDPTEAIGRCKAQSYDLVLSDIVMGDMDGHELARRLALLCPRTRVVLMTGFDPGCDNCPYSPRCELVRKPFDLKEVLSAVARELAGPSRRVRAGGSGTA